MTIPCLVLGGAACVWDDAAAAQEIFPFTATIAAKHIASAWPGPLVALVSLHPEKLGPTLAERKRAGFDMDFEVWCHKSSGARGKPTGRIDRTLAGEWGGSSGLFAVQVARHLGYDRIVLAGVPMDDSAHFNSPDPLEKHERYRRAWLAHRAEIAPYVRSMSGWTSKVLGKPDFEWLSRA
jgi:hypothetical protein